MYTPLQQKNKLKKIEKKSGKKKKDNELIRLHS